MRPGPILPHRIGRAAAFIVLGVAIVAATVRFDRHRQAAPPAQVHTLSSLDAELTRCRTIKNPEDVDPACRAAWAEIRQHFFAPDDAGRVQP